MSRKSHLSTNICIAHHLGVPYKVESFVEHTNHKIETNTETNISTKYTKKPSKCAARSKGTQPTGIINRVQNHLWKYTANWIVNDLIESYESS